MLRYHRIYHRNPDAALLQPSDLAGASTATAPSDLRPDLRPPQPSSTVRYPSAGLRADARTISAMYRTGDRPTVLLEYLAMYHGNGAAQYLWAVREAVAAPGGRSDQTGHWSLLATGTAGPNSLLIQLRQRYLYEGSTVEQDTYLIVARVGPVILVLADLGWEAGDGHRALVEQLGTVAITRLVSATDQPGCPRWRG